MDYLHYLGARRCWVTSIVFGGEKLGADHVQVAE